MKKFLEDLANRVPPVVWFLFALYAASMAVLGFCLTLELEGAPIRAAYTFLTGGMSDKVALAVAIMGSLMTTTFTFFCGKATGTFFKKAIETPKAPDTTA